jgi:hypothetical protein
MPLLVLVEGAIPAYASKDPISSIDEIHKWFPPACISAVVPIQLSGGHE